MSEVICRSSFLSRRYLQNSVSKMSSEENNNNHAAQPNVQVLSDDELLQRQQRSLALISIAQNNVPWSGAHFDFADHVFVKMISSGRVIIRVEGRDVSEGHFEFKYKMGRQFISSLFRVLTHPFTCNNSSIRVVITRGDKRRVFRVHYNKELVIIGADQGQVETDGASTER